MSETTTQKWTCEICHKWVDNPHPHKWQKHLTKTRSEVKNACDIGVWVVTRNEDQAVFIIVAETRLEALDCVPERWREECEIRRVSGQLPVQ